MQQTGYGSFCPVQTLGDVGQPPSLQMMKDDGIALGFRQVQNRVR
jgi:hypothetical protein